jgi:hypothetical protein
MCRVQILLRIDVRIKEYVIHILSKEYVIHIGRSVEEMFRVGGWIPSMKMTDDEKKGGGVPADNASTPKSV